MRRIGMLLPAAADDPEFQARVAAFLQELAQSGWTDRPQRADRHSLGRRQCRRIRKHAAELVALAPDVILAHGASTVAALLQVTRTVPIVFPVAGDPVGAGFVDSLARPGGNATGFMRVRIQHGRKMAGAAQADCAGRDARGGPSRSRQPPAARPVRRHPGRGAVAQGGGHSDQRARRRRDRARRRGLRALLERRPDRDGEPVRGRFIAI